MRFVAWTLLAGTLLFSVDGKAGNGQPDQVKYQPLGGSVVTAGSTLAFGGSFGPPTLEHMGIIARLMYRFGFAHGKIMPTLPYKPGVGTSEQITDITTVAVKHFDEVLDLNGIPHQRAPTEFTNASAFAWKDDDHHFRVTVDDYDIRKSNRQNTLETLTYLQEQSKGDAKKVFWISGGDSFASVPTWMTQWQEMFDRANWVVVARPGFTENGIDFYKTNPLQAVFDETFLSRYHYTFDVENQVHNYVSRDANKPGIFIVSQPVLNYSSSLARNSFAAPDHHHIAQAGLQPSVFRHCLERGYYSEASDANYRAFTEQNLGIYLRHLLTKLESQTGIQQETWQNEFQELSQRLITLLAKSKRDAKKPSFNMRETWVKFLETTAKAWHSIPKPREILETRALRRELGGGDLSRYEVLRNRRNQLLRGDPRQIFARTLEPNLGLNGQALEMNLIASRLPAWLPLWIRKRDNERVIWHDLNVSTNEMAALLRDDRLVASIRNIAQDNQTVLTTLLRQAIQGNSRALTRYRTFAAARYFRRIALGAISPEILAGFSSTEQAAITRLQRQHQNLDEKLSTSEIAHYAEAIGHIYALTRLFQLEPHKVNDSRFWYEYRDLLATDYPGYLHNPNNLHERERLNALVPLIEEGLRQTLSTDLTAPPVSMFADQTSYRVSERAITAMESLLPLHTRRSPHDRLVSLDRLRHAVQYYVGANSQLFKTQSPNEREVAMTTPFKLLPLMSTGDREHSGNLIWEIKKNSFQLNREFQLLEASFDAAMVRLLSQPTHASSDGLFLEARHQLRAAWAKQIFDLKTLEYRILRTKSDLPFAALESELPTHASFIAELSEKRRQFNSTIEKLRTLTQVMLGSVSSHLGRDHEALRAEVEKVIGVTTALECRTLIGRQIN